jgi:hypothetical protein
MSIRQLYESSFARAVASCGVLLLTWLLLEANVLPDTAHTALSDIANTGLNEADLEMQTRNYYREVSDVNIGRVAGLGKFLNEIGLKAAPKGDDGTAEPPALGRTSIVHQNHAFLPWELNPSAEIVFQGHPLRTNRWGMRDKDYEKSPPPDTYRMALMGASNSMGNGVSVEDCYADVLEERLNADLAGKGYAHYELLNFSVGGYELTDRLYVASEKIPEFEPDIIFVVVLVRDVDRAVYQRVAERLMNRIPLHFEFLEQIAREAGAEPGDRDTKLRQRLHPFRARLLKGCAEEMKRLSDRTGIPVVAVVLNLLVGPTEQDLLDAASICEGAGVPTLRIFNAYEGYAEDQVYIAPTDRHPTPTGHRLIADEFYSIMLGHPVLGPMIRGETRKDAADDAP